MRLDQAQGLREAAEQGALIEKSVSTASSSAGAVSIVFFGNEASDFAVSIIGKARESGMRALCLTEDASLARPFAHARHLSGDAPSVWQSAVDWRLEALVLSQHRSEVQNRLLVNELKAVKEKAQLWLWLHSKLSNEALTLDRLMLALPSEPTKLMQAYAAIKLRQAALKNKTIFVAAPGAPEASSVFKLANVLRQKLNLNVEAFDLRDGIQSAAVLSRCAAAGGFYAFLKAIEHNGGASAVVNWKESGRNNVMSDPV